MYECKWVWHISLFLDCFVVSEEPCLCLHIESLLICREHTNTPSWQSFSQRSKLQTWQPQLENWILETLSCTALHCPPFPSSAHPTPSSNTEIVNDSVERTHNYSARNCYNYYFNLRLMLKFGAKVQKSWKASYILGNSKIIMTLVGEWDIYPLFQRLLDNPGVSSVKPIICWT